MSTVFENLFSAKVGHVALFRQLCKNLELNKKTCRILNQIVTELQIENPAMIFVDPSIIREGIKLPFVADEEEDTEMLREIYFRWFGGAI